MVTGAPNFTTKNTPFYFGRKKTLERSRLVTLSKKDNCLWMVTFF